ncbi:MAG: hypothetical protein RMI85_02585 [Candidatus Korarchaeum sp.]|nr:hypothetical protein [Candidatus Korarchaeum sp.]
MSKRSGGKEFEGFLFVTFMFLGMGIGFLFDNIAPGLFIGMGLGFLAMALAEILIKKSAPLEEEVSEAEKISESGDKAIESLGTFILILLGLGFVLGGSSILLEFEIPWRVFGSVFMILLGMFFLTIAMSRLKLLKRALA